MSKLTKYKLSDLYTMSSGISSKPEQSGHGSPFVSFRTIFNNYFLPNELTELMAVSSKEQVAYSVKKGDIFITRTSETLDELAISSVALKDYPGATFSGFAKRLRPKKDNLTYDKFMAFYMRSNYFRKAVDNNAIMTLRASFNEEIFSYIEVFLPKYEEQVAIGDLLYSLNAKIELNNKINSTLEKVAKLIYDYWFIQFDFPDENGKPYKSSGGKMVWNEELKREIPEGWALKTIDSLLNKFQSNSKKIQNKEIQKDGFFPVITQENGPFIAGFTNNDVPITNLPIIVFGDHSCTLRYVNFPFFQGADGTQILLFKPYQTYYLYLFLQSVLTQIPNYGKYERHFKYIKELRVILPPEILLKKFDSQVCSILERSKIIRNELKLLENFRDWLLPLLMNGQVTVKEDDDNNNY